MVLCVLLLLPGCSNVREATPGTAFFHSAPAEALAATAARWLGGDTAAGQVVATQLGETVARRDAQPDELVLAARLAWLQGRPEQARMLIRRCEEDFGEMDYAYTGVPLKAVCRAWEVSLAYQEGDSAVVAAALARARELLVQDTGTPWQALLCHFLSAFEGDGTAGPGCATPPVCAGDSSDDLTCITARIKAHAAVFYGGSGAPWPKGLTVVDGNEEATFRVSFTAISLLVGADALLAGFGGPPDNLPPGSAFSKDLFLIHQSCCEHALTRRLPMGLLHSARFLLGGTLMETGNVPAGTRHLESLMTEQAYYGPYCAIVLNTEGASASGWNRIELFETYPWLVDYLDP